MKAVKVEGGDGVCPGRERERGTTPGKLSITATLRAAFSGENCGRTLGEEALPSPSPSMVIKTKQMYG